MLPPDYGTDDLEFRDPRQRAWARIPPKVLILSLLFFAVFLYEVPRNGQMPLLVDNLFMLIHESGHILFQFLGMTAAVAGGTFLQLFVPFALAFYFAGQRQPSGVAFCIFLFFEQFVPISKYIGDAQAKRLPFFTLGKYEHVIHDWNYLLTKLSILSYDRLIADVVRFIGYLGMIGAAFWLLWRFLDEFYGA